MTQMNSWRAAACALATTIAVAACSNPDDGTGGAPSTGSTTSQSAATTKSASVVSSVSSTSDSGSTTEASSSSGMMPCTTPHCLLWSRVFEGAGAKIEDPQVTIDAANHVWIFGALTGAADFGLGLLSTVKKAPLLLELAPDGTTLRSELVSTTDEAYFLRVARSSGGMIYAWGDHRGPISFGNGVTLPAAVGLDPFLVAYDAAGVAQWVKTGNTQPFAIAADADGGVIILGNIVVEFDGHGINSMTSPGFAMKFDAAGTWQWTAELGNTQTSVGYAAAADSNGDIFAVVTDVFGYSSSRIVKLAKATGAELWSTPMSMPYAVGWPLAITTTPSGNARVTGFLVTGTDGHGGWAGPTYALDVDANGTLDTASSITFQNGDLPQASSSIAVDGQGRTALAGIFSGTIVLDQTYTQNVPYPSTGGPTDLFFAVIQDGSPPTPLWSQHVGAYGDVFPTIAFDSGGSLVFAAQFNGMVDVGGGTISSAGDSVVVAKYAP